MRKVFLSVRKKKSFIGDFHEARFTQTGPKNVLLTLNHAVKLQAKSEVGEVVTDLLQLGLQTFLFLRQERKLYTHTRTQISVRG